MSTTHRLGDLVLLLRGNVPANTVDQPDGPRFFGLAEISARGTADPRYIESATELRDPIVLAEGDVVVALLGKIGEATVIGDDAASALLGRECVALRVTNTDVLRPAWLCAWMSSAECQFQVGQHITGSTMPRLSIRALQNFALTVPSVDGQIEVEGLVQRFDAAIGATTRTLRELEALREAELQLAMTDRTDAATSDASDSDV